jgi:hypothetical protein
MKQTEIKSRDRSMSYLLRQYLLDAYAANRDILPGKIRKDFPIQIDDQDDDDNLSEFCNIFVTVKKNSRFEIDIFGNIPITQEISDFAEIYGGFTEKTSGRIVLNISPRQAEALIDLAKKIRKTASLGDSVNNANWHRTSARTISSLYRFVRILKEYSRSISGRL